MDRSEAATTLFRWQLDGQADLVDAVNRHRGALVGVVQEVDRTAPRPAPPPSHPPPPPPPSDFLRLREEEQVGALRRRLRAMTGGLQAKEKRDVEVQLRDDVLPQSRIDAIRTDLDQMSGRADRGELHRDFEALLTGSHAQGPHAVLLFSRDGWLSAQEGEVTGLDMSALSDLAARAEPGHTWTLSHRGHFLIGHSRQGAVLVAVFANPPSGNVPLALRASLASLEDHASLLNTLDDPRNRNALAAYVHAVRLLLQKHSHSAIARVI